MAPKMAAALMPKLDAAPVFSTGGVEPVAEGEPSDSVAVAEGEPVEMVLLTPWLGTREAEAEAVVLMVVGAAVAEAEAVADDLPVE